MSGKALPAEHNGDIWSREATMHGAILPGKNQRFLLGVSIIPNKNHERLAGLFHVSIKD